jgi:hypothetical protein
MIKDCIICGGRTGSREHVFPAALGGRRTNKGIYCASHNEGFSPLAAILSNQLGAINAYLAVRPDHSDEPRRFEMVNPSDGQRYLLSALNVELAEPKVVKDVVVERGRQLQMIFSNEHHLQEWLAAQRAAGVDLRGLSRGEPSRGFFAQPYKLRLKIGGPEGLRAIGYVALTFLAHYFPQTARHPGLKAFKNFVLGANDEHPVCWDFNDLPNDSPQNSFRFGHRILIGLSSSRQEAYARVSLFSTLSFAAHFGAVSVDKDQTLIVDIDPQADQPPADVRETWGQELWAEVQKPASPTTSLRETAESGAGRARFELLFRKITDWQIECVGQELLPKITETRALGVRERFPRVKQLLGEQGQRVLNLMVFFVAGLKRQFEADPATAAIGPVLDKLVAADRNSGSGISQTTQCALELAKAALADRICRDLDEGKLNLERLSLLLGGGPGAAIVGEAILQPFKIALGIVTPNAGV